MRAALLLLSGCLYTSTSGDASAPAGLGTKLECEITRYCGHVAEPSTISPCTTSLTSFIDEFSDECHAGLAARGCPGYLCVIDCKDTYAPCLLDNEEEVNTYVRSVIR